MRLRSLAPVLLLVLAACPGRREPDASSRFAVAQLENGAISCADLQDLRTEARPRSVALQEGESEAEWRGRLVRQLAVQVNLAAEAEKQDAEDAARFDERWRITRRAILRQAQEARLEAEAAIPEEEIERYFEEHRGEFGAKETITTRFILRKVAPEAGEEAWRREEELLRQLRERALTGEAFGALARQYSQAENAPRGGAVKTSPRGTLLPQFEEVAWALTPGAVSEVVRLPDGPALVQLERRNAARSATLERARRRIERRLRDAALASGTEALLRRACGSWPPSVDAEAARAALAGGATSVQVGGVSLDAAFHELAPNAPWWEERLLAALREECLDRAAERLAEEPETAARLAFEYRGLLAAWATDQRLDACLPEVPEAQLRDFYEQHRATFMVQESRLFEVVSVPAEPGHQRAASATAEAAAAAWRSSGAPPAGLQQVRWGPLTQGELSAATSPLVARRAFALEPGAPSAPLPLERYRAGRGNFEVAGYAVLEVAEITPAAVRPFEEVRERIHAYLARGEKAACLESLLADIERDSGLAIDEAALARCDLAPPSGPPGSVEGDGVGGGEAGAGMDLNEVEEEAGSSGAG